MPKHTQGIWSTRVRFPGQFSQLTANFNKVSPQVLAQHFAKSPSFASVPRCIELAAGRFALPSLVLAASGHCQMMLATDLLGVVDYELPRKYGNLTSEKEFVEADFFYIISYLLNMYY